MNKLWRHTIRAGTAVGFAVSCFVADHPAPVAAQGGSIPLRGGVQRPQEQEGRPLLFASPSGELYRIWNRLRVTDQEGGGALFLASSPDGIEWKTLTQILPEGKGISAFEGSLAVNSAGDIALPYRWVRYHPKAKRVRLARSLDGGKTWAGLADNYVDQVGQAFDPQAAWGEGKTLVVAWADERIQGKRFRIFVRRSTDGGASWEPEVLLSGPDMIGADYDTAPRLFSDEKGRFWLFYIASRGGQSAIMLTRSDDDGRTWAPHQRISGPSSSVYSLTVSREGNRFLASWEDQRRGSPNRVYAAVSKDGGVTWTSTVEIAGLPASSRAPAAGVSSVLTPSGEAWAAWHDDRSGRSDIFASRSPDGGLTWGEAIRLDTDGAGTAVSRYPRMAISKNGSLAVVWEDDRHGFEAIYARIFSGGRWSAEARLGQETLQPKRAGRVHRIIATPQNTFYVVWEVWDHSHGGGAVKSIEGTVLRVP